jgi:hypothetical protein
MPSFAPAAIVPVRSLAGYAAAAPSRPASGFRVFLLVNAALFLRPAEIVPGLIGLEIYLFLIVPCLLIAFPAVWEQLSVRALDGNPITVCVIALLPAVILSHMCRFHVGGAAASGWEFFKVVIYYLLFVCLVTTPERLLRFFFWLAIFASILALIAVLEYQDWIHLPTLKTLGAMERDQVSGRDIVVRRLQATGPFHDPNDFCVLLVVGILSAAHGLTEVKSGVRRWLWLGPLAVLFYAFSLTQSRGGFLALLGGLFAFLLARFGWRKTLGLTVLGLPVLLIAFGGRQTELSTGTGTGQERIQIWSDGLLMFRDAPLFGVGMNEFDKLVGHVAHNSYLQAFAELGLLGGTLFVGAVYLAMSVLWRARARDREIVDPKLRRLHPYLTGAVAGYAVGMFSLTLTYIVPTYMVLGLAASWNRIAETKTAAPPITFDVRLIRRLLGSALLFLVGLTLFVRVFFNH